VASVKFTPEGSPMGSDEAIDFVASSLADRGGSELSKSANQTQKKGRFVLDSTNDSANAAVTHSRKSSASAPGPGVVSAIQTQTASSVLGAEIKKGRFSVIDSSTTKVETSPTLGPTRREEGRFLI
jgi:hypothetical protein